MFDIKRIEAMERAIDIADEILAREHPQTCTELAQWAETTKRVLVTEGYDINTVCSAISTVKWRV